MNPQQGTGLETAAYSKPLSPEIIVLIVFFATIVIGAFTIAMASFIRAGKKDSEDRRRRGVPAKDPLDPHLPEQKD